MEETQDLNNVDNITPKVDPDNDENEEDSMQNPENNSPENTTVYSEEYIKNLIKNEDEIDNNYNENYEISPDDLDSQFNDEFDDEQAHQEHNIKQLLFNNTTAYTCQMCGEVIQEFAEYKIHKKNHFIEKRRCYICQIVCKSIGTLEEHVNAHLGIKPYKCEECGKAFVAENHLKLHSRVHSAKRTHNCEKCGKTYKDLGSLRLHSLVHFENIEEFKCKVCGEDCKTDPNLRKHMLKHDDKTPKVCGVCSKTFNNQRVLDIHLGTHKELTYPCEYCLKIFPTLYKLKKHVGRVHIPNHCDECDQIFYDRAQYTKHKKGHAEIVTIFQCKICSKTYDKPKNLSEHMRLQHTSDGKENKCEICGKEFINLSLLKNHVKNHNKCFKCNFCDLLFSSRYNLETHSVVHTKIRNFSCEICNKSYTTKTSLKNHTATHNDERSFECDVCLKRFKSNRRLYVHKFCHKTEEKFSCEICGAKFKVKQYLKYHMKKHSTEKPFPCEICGKKFKHKKSYLKHMNFGKHETEDAVITIDCDFCDESFETRDKLLDHFAIQHEQQMIEEAKAEGVIDYTGYTDFIKKDIKRELEDNIVNCIPTASMSREDASSMEVDDIEAHKPVALVKEEPLGAF